ncbi:unnamed protein product [Ectocarpus sp. 6 AP-2014]
MGDGEHRMAVNLSKLQVWTPQAVHALATRPDSKVVAVGREDGDVELTVPSEGYRVEARVPGQKNKGLRSLAWIGGTGGDGGVEGDDEGSTAIARLFGCGLDGTVFEVDLLRLCYKNVRDAYGGAAWCMRPAAPLGLLAVGCEDGSVRLFSTEGGGVEYKRSFPSTGSRVLCLAWGPANDVIFAGCLDSMIHCLDATTGQTLFDMRLERGRKEDAIVWALEALSDGTVVSSDSCGRVQVWDGLTGTQLQSLTTHEADVLCLCVAESETELFASGCDGKVVSLEKRQAVSTLPSDMEDATDDGQTPARMRQGWEWTVGSMRREHTHDVKALAIHEQSLDERTKGGGVGVARKGPVLVSGGVDASLSLYSVPGFKTQARNDSTRTLRAGTCCRACLFAGPRPMEPLPPVPVAFLARDPRLVLIMHNRSLDLWEVPRHKRSFSAEDLGDLEDGTVLDGSRSDAASGGVGVGGETPPPVVRLRLEPKTDKGGHLACAAISAAGDLVAVSNTKETKLYRISRVSSSGKALSGKRVRLPGTCSPPAHALAFTRDGRRLVVAAAAGDIRIVDLDAAEEDKGSGPDISKATAGRAGAGARLVHCFEEHVDGVRPGGGDEGALPVSAITLSANGKWLVSCSVSGVVYVFDLVGLRHHWTAPSFSASQRVAGLTSWSPRVLGVRFHSRDDILVCVDSSNAFRLLDVQRRRLAACHDGVEFPQLPSGKGSWGGQGDVRPLSGIAFNPEDPQHCMLLFNHRSVVLMTPRRKIPLNVCVKPTKAKKARLAEGDRDKAKAGKASGKGAANQSNFRMIRDFSSVVLMDFLGPNELLVLENPWEAVKESLPEVLDRKQYGV